MFPNWSYRTALFRAPICKWNTLFPNWSFRLFCFKFLFVRGTYCSQIDKLGLFCSEFLIVRGTHCSPIGHLALFCSEFLFVRGTYCCQIDNLGLFCFEFPSMNGTLCSQTGHLCTRFRTVSFHVPMWKWLHLEKDEADSLYHCPIQECDHDGFQSQRGCRKHVNTKHSWFFYFDKFERNRFCNEEHNSRSNKGNHKTCH